MTWNSIEQIAPELQKPGRTRDKKHEEKHLSAPPPSHPPPWTKDQIRQARRTPLAPLLKKRGYHLRKKPNDNFLIEEEADLVVKESYWIWPSREMKGNAIDFLMLVECRSFHEAMEILTRED